MFTPEDAVKAAADGKKVILVREETSPEDIEGMRAAAGILTIRINQVQQLSQLLPSFLGGVMYGLVGIRPMMLITAACLMSAAMVECFIRLAKPLSNQDDTGICLLGVIIGDMHSATAFLLRKEPTVGG